MCIFKSGIGSIVVFAAFILQGWMKENNFTDANVKNVNPAKTYSLTVILSLIICYNLAFFLGDAKTDMMWGLTAGFLAGFGFSALIFTVIALFEMRSWKYILINGGYIIIYFSLVGLILGAWR